MPDRSYQYNTTRVTFPTMSFTGDSFEIDLSGEETGETVTITVMFQNNVCESMANISVTGKFRRSKRLGNLINVTPSTCSS